MVLDLDRNQIHTLNGTAALLWSCFDGVGTVDERQVRRRRRGVVDGRAEQGSEH